MKKININDVEKLTDLTNDFINKYIESIHPANYKDNIAHFIDIAITGPSIISATIIDKVAKTLTLNNDDVLELFIKKLKLALRWIDPKND